MARSVLWFLFFCLAILQSCSKEKEYSGIVVEPLGESLIIGDESSVSFFKEINETIYINVYNYKQIIELDLDGDSLNDVSIEIEANHANGGGSYYNVSAQSISTSSSICYNTFSETMYHDFGRDTSIGTDKVVYISEIDHLHCSFIENADSVYIRKSQYPAYFLKGEVLEFDNQFIQDKMSLENWYNGHSGWSNSAGDTIWTTSSSSKSCRNIPEGENYIGIQIQHKIVSTLGWIKILKDGDQLHILEIAMQ